ncbi:type II toxin-antitoxin system RelB family antitoxin [Pistricoccus aurantiacus]|uniref:type II toxin-antitoxin system RelB family antitoxin n=1 Tax=Pistricoccus aurantiacus TaxID=1883414 RepID=UPI003CCC8111
MRPPTFYLRKLVEEHLDDFEDTYLAEHALEQLRQGRDRIISAEEFWRDLVN